MKKKKGMANPYISERHTKKVGSFFLLLLYPNKIR